MISKLKVVTLIALLSLFANAVQALPIVTTTACINDGRKQCATGISDLEVMGTIFDVSFSQLSAGELFASSDPYFTGNPTGALAAMYAITLVLDRSVIGSPRRNSSRMMIPFFFDTIVRARLGYQATSTTWKISGSLLTFMTSDPSRSSPNHFDSYVTFTEREALVPVPATLVLMCMGLVGLGITRKNSSPRCHNT